MPSADMIDALARTLAQKSHSDLLRLREQPGADQNLIAPFEHRAFAREEVSQNPFMALPIGVAIPPYQLLKMLGGGGARSQPSLEQLKQGYTGIWEGLQNGR